MHHIKCLTKRHFRIPCRLFTKHPIGESALDLFISTHFFHYSAHNGILSGRFLAGKFFDFFNRQFRILCYLFIRHSICEHLQSTLDSFILTHFFHCSAHSCHSLRIVLKVLYPICRCQIEHILFKASGNIVHIRHLLTIASVDFFIYLHFSRSSTFFK